MTQLRRDPCHLSFKSLHSPNTRASLSPYFKPALHPSPPTPPILLAKRHPSLASEQLSPWLSLPSLPVYICFLNLSSHLHLLYSKVHRPKLFSSLRHTRSAARTFPYPSGTWKTRCRNSFPHTSLQAEHNGMQRWLSECVRLSCQGQLRNRTS